MTDNEPIIYDQRMNIIDFDFRKDSKSGDPDKDSLKLYETHKTLWNKTLPCRKNLDLKVIRDNYGRLVLKNSLCDNLSSDRMCPHYDGQYNRKCDGWLTDIEIEELKHKVRTIGGHIVFPGNKRNGFTINQARGVNRIICDRFDLTLECIRLYYQEQRSPLYDTLMRYKDFFDLFVDFDGYVDFFMLQDFIDEKGQINFSLPFDDFSRPALPQTAEEYKRYRVHTIDLLNKRNNRILNKLNNL
jgi:hypothetical protein